MRVLAVWQAAVTASGFVIACDRVTTDDVGVREDVNQPNVRPTDGVDASLGSVEAIENRPFGADAAIGEAGVGTGVVADAGVENAKRMLQDPELGILERFLALWTIRLSELSPGLGAPPDGAPAPCFDCVTANNADCDSSDATCEAAEACVWRHCLCVTPEFGCRADSLPASLDACVDGCFGENNEHCRPKWQAFSECILDACTHSCVE